MATRPQVVLLSAGLGSRLGQLTSILPKCLMPIRGNPLLEYWLSSVRQLVDPQVFINCHYRSNDVKKALLSVGQEINIEILNEDNLLGTAGTIKALAPQLNSDDVIVAHADNLTDINLDLLLRVHREVRPQDCWITMVTFIPRRPELCGTVLTDERGVATEFQEKSLTYKTNVSNAAVYVFSQEALSFISNCEGQDISTHIIPRLLRRTWTFHHEGIHRDIGTPQELFLSQFDCAPMQRVFSDDWHDEFQRHPIHGLIREYAAAILEGENVGGKYAKFQ